MIVFPVKKYIDISNIRFCVQCWKMFEEKEDTKDHGICSLECGYKIRGLHWSDFLESRMDIINNEIEVLKDLGKY